MAILHARRSDANRREKNNRTNNKLSPGIPESEFKSPLNSQIKQYKPLLPIAPAPAACTQVPLAYFFPSPFNPVKPKIFNPLLYKSLCNPYNKHL